MTEQNTAPQPQPNTALKLEPSLFHEYVAELELTATQETALLEAVWTIVVGVIDLGLGQSPLSKFDRNTNPLAADSSSVLASLSTPNSSNAEDATAPEGPDARRMDS